VSARHAAAGRIGAYEKWGRCTDRQAATAPGLRAASEKWLKEVRAEHPELDDRAAQLMAEARRRAHMARISQAGVEARRRKRAA
jgi:ABC-type phosphonate transport system ATPase subunit